MSVLVTGGSGFVGSSLTNFLLKNTKEDIIVLDLNSPKSDQNSQNLTFFQGDITSKRDIFRAFQGQKIKAVIHVAGFGLAGSSNLPAFNDITKKVNVEGTKNIIEASIKFNVSALGKILHLFNASFIDRPRVLS